MGRLAGDIPRFLAKGTRLAHLRRAGARMSFMRSRLSAGIVLTLLAMSAHADDYSFTGYARSLDTR